MGQNLTHIVDGEFLILASLEFFVLSDVIAPAFGQPWTFLPIVIYLHFLCLFVSIPIALYGGYLILLKGTLTGLNRQYGKGAVAGSLIAFTGLGIIVLSLLVTPQIMAWKMGVALHWVLSPNFAVLTPMSGGTFVFGVIVFGGFQVVLGLSLITLMTTSYLRTR